MTVALVQSKTGTGTTTTLTITLTSPTTAGNCLVVAIGASANSLGTISSVKIGGAADNFAKAVSQANTSCDAEIWVDPNCVGGQTSVAIVISSLISGELYASVYEFSGIVTSSPVDKTSPGTTSGATTFSSGTTATTTVANEAWVGVVAESGGTTVTGPASPWTNTAQLGSGTKSGMAGEQIVTSTGTATYSGTVSSSSFTAACVVTLKGTATPVTSSGGLAMAGLGMGGTAAETITSTGGLRLAGPALHGTAAETITSTGGLRLAGPALHGTAAETIGSSGGLAMAGLGLHGTAAETITSTGGLRMGGLAMSGSQATPVVTSTGGLRMGGLGMGGRGGPVPAAGRAQTVDDGTHRIRRRRRRMLGGW